MKAERFQVTYEIVTPESAEQGEADSVGFASPGGWQHTDPAALDLAAAVRACGYYGRPARYAFEDSGRWFTTTDADQNYRTGEETRYSIHPPENITPASYRRLARYLTGGTR